MVSCSSAHMHAQDKAKVWRLARTGNIAELTLQEDAVPSPKAGQATVAVKAVSYLAFGWKLGIGQVKAICLQYRLASTLQTSLLAWVSTKLHQRRT